MITTSDASCAGKSSNPLFSGLDTVGFCYSSMNTATRGPLGIWPCKPCFMDADGIDFRLLVKQFLSGMFGFYTHIVCLLEMALNIVCCALRVVVQHQWFSADIPEGLSSWVSSPYWWACTLSFVGAFVCITRPRVIFKPDTTVVVHKARWVGRQRKATKNPFDPNEGY